MNRQRKSDCHGKPGFSLIELLVVITIVALLIATIIPSLSKSREVARQARCMANLKQYGVALHTYSNDFSGYIIPQMFRSASGVYGRQQNWGLILSLYTGETYGPLANWEARDVSHGATAKAGTVHVCPSENYLNGVPADMISTLSEAYGQVGYGNSGSTASVFKYWFTTYAMNIYASRRRTTAWTGGQVDYQSFNRGVGSDMRKLDNKRYPSELWFFTEGYPTANQMVVGAAALTRSKFYAKVNFERHPGNVNILYLDGHAGSYMLGSRTGDVADPYDTPLNEQNVNQYKHWGVNDDSSTGW